MNKEGFTLLELAIVLGIIALLTHLAVREMGQWRQSKLHDVAIRQMEEIKIAILGDDFERDLNGVRTRNGFVADMGRLPVARLRVDNELYVPDVTPLGLYELWLPPRTEKELYNIRSADETGILEYDDDDDDKDEKDADSDVRIAGGWRGPYIRLPFGATELRDPWGNPFTVPDDAGYHDRLRGENNSELGIDMPIEVIRHLGADGAPDDQHPPATMSDKDSTCDLMSDTRTVKNTELTVELTINDEPASGTENAIVRLYSPLGGKIKILRKKIKADNKNPTFTDIAPGPKVLTVECDNEIRLRKKVIIQPGPNGPIELSIKL